MPGGITHPFILYGLITDEGTRQLKAACDEIHRCEWLKLPSFIESKLDDRRGFLLIEGSDLKTMIKRLQEYLR